MIELFEALLNDLLLLLVSYRPTTIIFIITIQLISVGEG